MKLFKEGKVRTIYDFDDHLLLITSDRVSAFDSVLPQTIPTKGKLLTQLAAFWFDYLDFPHHLVSTTYLPDAALAHKDAFKDRSMWVKKADRIDIECIIRGYLAGSGWESYQKTGEIKGHRLPDNLQLGSQLPEPIFTPTTKADTGHDEAISLDDMKALVGNDLTETLQRVSLDLYQKAHAYASEKNIIIADTKFEFGYINGQLSLIDEVFTPDSSRFWPADYTLGVSPPSYDKQIIRDYLTENGRDAVLPEAIIRKTVEKYTEITTLLT